MPIMERIALEMAGAVAVLAVGADSGEAPPKLAAFASSLGITFPVLYDQGEAALRYRVIGIPTSFFIDREGVVRARVEGPLEEPAIRKHVEAILGGGR
jgi:cytochrome c biogenesis protein CcmG, thiol:disulfide interchange protein DsbE